MEKEEIIVNIIGVLVLIGIAIFALTINFRHPHLKTSPQDCFTTDIERTGKLYTICYEEK